MPGSRGGGFWMWEVGSRLVSSEGERLESREEELLESRVGEKIKYKGGN